jgi:hypothetical protein
VSVKYGITSTATVDTASWAYTQLSLYPDEKKHGWFKRVSPFVYGRFVRDRVQGGDGVFGLVGVRSNFTRQGPFRLDFAWGREPWAGREFPRRFVRAIGGGAAAPLARQANRWRRRAAALRGSPPAGGAEAGG